MLKIKRKVANFIVKNEKILLIAVVIIVAVVIATAITYGIWSKNKARQTYANSILENEKSNEIEDNKIDSEIIVNIGDSGENTIGTEVNEQNNNVVNTQTGGQASNGSSTTSKDTPYYIKVNYGAQVVTIYSKDSEGKYAVPVKAMVCSTGVATPTTGVYKITSYRKEWNGLQGDVYGKYATQIVGNILFHSVPYLKKGDSGSLEYWEYDKLGTYASAGCIRLTVADALWIYNNCGRGTSVEFYSSSEPGPLGKPVAKKISSAEGDLKNWDPTDPSADNPWKNYKPESNNNEEKESNNEIITNEVYTNGVVKNKVEANEIITNTEVVLDEEIENNEVSSNSIDSSNNSVNENKVNQNSENVNNVYTHTEKQ